jgi:chemotaxis protein MotB
MEPGKENEAPIIIVRKHGRHDGHHGGAWKVAYADFVTAMMAFFLVMWLVNQSDKVKAGVGGYFRDPVGFANKAGSSVLEGSAGVVNSPKAARDAEEYRKRQEEKVREKLQTKAQEITKALHAEGGLGELSKLVEVEVTDEGLRIQLMESGDSTFFGLGSAQLSGEGVHAVTMIANQIGPLGYKVALEGHTDSRKYVNRSSYSNWELSADRANSARRILEQNGVDPGKITEIRGYADTHLRYADRPEDAGNRRIAIVVLNSFSRENFSPIDMSERDKLAGKDLP